MGEGITIHRRDRTVENAAKLLDEAVAKAIAEGEARERARVDVCLDSTSLRELDEDERGEGIVVWVQLGLELNVPAARAADLVLLPHEALGDEALAEGVAASKIRIVGPLPFLLPPRQKVPKRSEPLTLVVDSSALKTLRPTLVQLSLVKADVHFIFDVGRDVELAERLRGDVAMHLERASMFTSARTLSPYDEAHAVLAALGSPTAQMAVAARIPLVAPSPGAELERLAHRLEATSVVAVADAEQTLCVTLDQALGAEGLDAALRCLTGLDAEKSAERIAHFIGRAGETEVVPRGLPQGLEGLTEGAGDIARPSITPIAAPAPEADDEALEKHIDAEMERLRALIRDQ